MRKRFHLIGIGGSGLSAIARVLLESDYAVSGSDRVLSPLTDELKSAGAMIYEGHRAENVSGADIVVRSSAIPDNNPEVQAALAAGIPVLKRSEIIGQITANHTTVAIAGTHGKTTTTAMTAWLLHRLGYDPSFIIGGLSKDLGSNAHAGQGGYFVIEADEYDHMFLGLTPDWILLTHLEHDHPDCFPTMKDYRQAFIDFIHQLRPGGGLLTCLDYSETAAAVAHVPSGCSAYTYGLSESANYFARNLRPDPAGGISFALWFHQAAQPATLLAQIQIQIPGIHNVRNALAVLGLAHRLDLPLDLATAALSEFRGTGRRFDLLGEVAGIAVYDDYAHHPTKIRATLAAARQRYPDRRIWAVWQPHTYSRTQALFNEFVQAFSDADQVLVTEVYAAREANPGFSAVELASVMKNPPALFAPTLEQAVRILLDELKPGDVLFVLSAGDADQISQQVFKALSEREKLHE